MVAANNVASSYGKALLTATPSEMLVVSKKAVRTAEKLEDVQV